MLLGEGISPAALVLQILLKIASTASRASPRTPFNTVAPLATPAKSDRVAFGSRNGEKQLARKVSTASPGVALAGLNTAPCLYWLKTITPIGSGFFPTAQPIVRTGTILGRPASSDSIS